MKASQSQGKFFATQPRGSNFEREWKTGDKKEETLLLWARLHLNHDGKKCTSQLHWHELSPCRPVGRQCGVLGLSLSHQMLMIEHVQMELKQLCPTDCSTHHVAPAAPLCIRASKVHNGPLVTSSLAYRHEKTIFLLGKKSPNRSGKKCEAFFLCCHGNSKGSLCPLHCLLATQC